MKKLGISLLMSLLVSVGFASNTPVDGDIDLENSKVTWTGKKVTGKHTGTIDIKEANFSWTDGALSGGQVVIDMTSLSNSDLAEKANMQAKLVGHLKSADFFNVEEHPTATLDITKVVHRGTEGSYKIVGDLTIKGITKPIKFNAQFGEKDGKHIATADIVVDRSEYDVRYGSGSFFENLGDKTIYDEFELSVHLAFK